MGTRGFTGLVIDNQEKMGYQQYDSYPSGVGLEVLEEVRKLSKDMKSFKDKARALQVVSNDTPPTEEQIKKCSAYVNTGVGGQSTSDWYCVLRETQGSLEKILDCGFVEDHSGFALDSLFCEYGYLVDLDGGTFQVYEGFQKDVPQHGRWAGRPTAEENAANYEAHIQWCSENDRAPWIGEEAEYKAVRLLAEWTLDRLPTSEEFLRLTEPQEEEE